MRFYKQGQIMKTIFALALVAALAGCAAGGVKVTDGQLSTFKAGETTKAQVIAAVNEVYATYFPTPAPARATIQAARLPRDVKVEIDVVAYLG